MKKVVSLLLCFTLALAFPVVPAFAQDGISVVINGVTQSYDQMPVMVNDRVLVPMRGIFEALGADVTWDDATQTVTGVKDGKTITLTIGDTNATVDGAATVLDVPAQLVNDRTMVPVRFISESLGTEVRWNDTLQKVIINVPYIAQLPKVIEEGITPANTPPLSEIPNIPGASRRRPIPTEFEKSAALDDLIFYDMPGDPDEAFEKLSGGTVMVTQEDFYTVEGMSGNTKNAATVEKVSVEGMPFSDALRFTVTDVPDHDYACALELKNDQQFADGDIVLMVVYTRLISGGSNDTGDGRVCFAVQETESNSYTAAVKNTVEVKNEWQKTYIPFVANAKVSQKPLRYHIRPALEKQVVEVGGYQLINYGSKYTQEDMPDSAYYEGMEEDAQWRKDALARIEQHRKGDFNIIVQDAAGNVVPDAQIKADMYESEFEWGTAIGPRLVQEGEDSQKYRENYVKYFNSGVAETIHKWNYYDADPETANKIVDWSMANGIRYFRGHCLFWDTAYEPNNSRIPADIPQYIANGEDDKIKARVLDHIKEEAGNFAGRMTEWDVTNEITRLDSIILPHFGNYDFLHDLFNTTRQVAPDAKLYMTECGLSGIDSFNYREFIPILDWAKETNLDYDGIGVQGHQGNPKNPMIFYEMLDALAQYGKEIKITEFDVKLQGSRMNRNLQANFTRDILIAIYSHPSVVGLTMWGFWDSNTGDAPLFNKDWTMKESGKEFEDLVYNKWWTRESGATGADGSYAFRGFFGDYDITVTANGQTKTAEAKFYKDSDHTLVITLD